MAQTISLNLNTPWSVDFGALAGLNSQTDDVMFKWRLGYPFLGDALFCIFLHFLSNNRLTVGRPRGRSAIPSLGISAKRGIFKLSLSPYDL